MGSGFSTELGEASHNHAVQQHLASIYDRLATDDATLTTIEVPNMGLGDEGAQLAGQALARAVALQHLDLSYNVLSPKGVALIMDGLSCSLPALKGLKVLRLSGNTIDEEAMSAVCHFLSSDPFELEQQAKQQSSTEEADTTQQSSSSGPQQHDPSHYQTADEVAASHTVGLEELYLYNCKLTDAHMLQLVNALLVNPTLHTLHLDMNDITNKTAIMFRKLLETNRGLAKVSFGADAIKLVMKHEVVEQIKEDLSRNAELLSHKAEVKRIKALKQQRREERERIEKETREAQTQQELQRKAAEMAALEELRRSEEEEVNRLQAIMTAKMQARGEAAERMAQKRQQAVQQAIDNAEKWKSRLTANGTLVKEWRNGFTVLRSEPGDLRGVPTLSTEAPRRLVACWCDEDATAPYSGTLHYHCVHEMAKHKSLDQRNVAGPDDDGRPPTYEGCKGEFHVCASERKSDGKGGTAKPLPDPSAAHFFASKHPEPTLNVA